MREFNFYFKILNYVPIVIVVLFIVILVVGAVFLWPKYQKLSEIQSNIEGKEVELQNSEEYFANLGELDEKLGKYPQELPKVDSALPGDPSLSSLFYFIQQTSSESGLVLVKISPFTTAFSMERPNIKEVTFTVSLLGSYSALKYLLATLETSSRMIEVEGISFSKVQEEDSFDFELGLKTFSY